MKLIAVCGSARKQGNTSKMLHQVIEGAKSIGAETEFVNLFDLNYKGCTSCYACKLKNSKSYGHCMQNDELKPLLERIEQSDVIVIGSPIYYGNLSGQMRSFTDRLLFQYLDYGARGTGPKPKNFKTALITTMNGSDEDCIERGVKDTLNILTEIFSHTLGSCELLNLTNTVMFDDYSKYVYEMPDIEEKSNRMEKISTENMKKAFDLGVRLIKS
ncbi:NADPH-dependent FMN reductase [Clostridium acidisoli DSM 12555]|uniref:NADPH-dependent FMN reductase n=1 Tax=Clostridium acidisoli DSM 12555 TaxID=1121291 RepID=A0A1W1XQF9_9CLOT|nr:flavodoxin family protein [Clostridium acidisoli]SMC26193.1 NADPH-dependent FMN reductase [Clostridium acidisoli DSM 12555]